MSRRARRQRGAGKNPWLGKVLVSLGVFAILISGAGYLALRSYLSSESFRDLLSAKVGAAAMVEGEFSPLQWDGLAVETDGFQGNGNGKGLVENLDVKRIATEIGFGKLTRGAWVIKATRIDRLQIDLNMIGAETPAPVAPEIREKKVTKKQPSWIPTEVELEALDIANMGLNVTRAGGTTSASGMAVRVRSDDGENAYKAEIQGGVVLFPQEWMPELRIKRISGTYRDGSLFIDEAEASVWEAGRIEAFGEANFKDSFHALEGSVSGVKCDEILSDSWAKRLTGDVASTFSLSNRTGRNVASGELSITNGVLTALPMLDALAAYADTRRFRVLQLKEARSKWRFADDEIFLSDLVLASEGLIQLEGSLSIKGEQIDGQFQLGIVPGVLSRIPGAETDVFRLGRLGLLWAPIRVTGTFSDPKEDLTPRLIEAAGMRMFERLPEGGERVLKYTRNMLGETPEEAIKNSRRLIEDGEKAIKDAEQIIKGFRGILGR